MKVKIIEKQKVPSGDPSCFQFDGKILQKGEYQAILLKNATTKIKYGVLNHQSDSTKSIHKNLHQLIDECNI